MKAILDRFRIAPRLLVVFGLLMLMVFVDARDSHGATSERSITSDVQYRVSGPGTNDSNPRNTGSPAEKPEPEVRVPDTFSPLLADPKEVSSHVNFVNVDSGDTGLGTFNAAFVGLGVSYPFYAEDWRTPEDGSWKVGLESVFLSQFNLDRPSEDLLNTDFLVGFPFEYRQGNFSTRVRLMHQSSHLGDEFLLSGDAPRRINLSVEFIDVLLAMDWGPVRLYGGGKNAFRRDPGSLDPGSAQAGVEYRGDYRILGGNPVFATDYQSLEVTDWETQLSVRFGFYFPRIGPVLRSTHVFFNAYDGPAPFGQFFTRDIEYYGLGIYMDL